MALTDIPIGFALVTVGVGSALLAALYWKAGGLTLLSFGLFSLLYGGRVLVGVGELTSLFGLSPQGVGYVDTAINYWLPVPLFIFAEQIFGSGWRSSLRRLWQASIGLALACMAYDMSVGPAAAFETWYRILIVLLVLVAAVFLHILWRGLPTNPDRHILAFAMAIFSLVGAHDLLLNSGLLPWTVPLERYGLSIFIVSLGYVVARQFSSNQQELATIEYELRTAGVIQASILPRAIPSVRDVRIAVRYVPMRTVAGDLYDFAAVDERHIAILIADVSGHGVPAALIASMAKVAFSAQSERADDPGELLGGMNRALCGHHLAGQFVTATYVYVDGEHHRLRYSSAGHPPPLLWKSGPGHVVELTEGAVFLGFDPDASYPTAEVPLDRGDRLVLYTDGVVEARSSGDDFFGYERLKQFVATNRELSTDAFAAALLERIQDWSGRGRAGTSLEDDLTLVVVDVLT